MSYRASLLLQQSVGGGFTLPNAQRHYAPDLELEPIELELDARLDVPGRTMSATVRHTLQARQHDARSIDLDGVGFEDVEVRSEDGRDLTWRYDGEKIRVRFVESLERGDHARIAVDYRVADPVAGLYFSTPDEAYPDAPRFVATDSETERARHWLATIDHPSVRPKLRFALRSDATFEILANGALEGEDKHEDGTKTVRWRLDFPCPSYLTCFAIGDFTRFDDDEADGIPCSYFATREFEPEHLERAFGRTPKFLRWMNDRLGLKLPFPKYFQFALPTIWGAMENISLVSWGDVFLLDDELAGEWTYLVDQINVHEMAHSWFGDAVVCRDYAHVWLKESWATYMEQVWYQELGTAEEANFEFLLAAESYFREVDNRYARPIMTRTFDHSWSMYDMHLYPGGACRLHTLRHVIGDDAFWRGTRRYLQEYCGKVVESADFRRIMEEESGKSLAHFFEQWFETAGFPDLEVTFVEKLDAGLGILTFKQKQIDDKKKIPAFRFDIDIAWEVEGEWHDKRVCIDGEQTQITFPLSASPTSLRVDPHARVLHRLSFNPGDDRLLRQLTGASDVIGRVLAGRELVKTGRTSNLKAVATAAEEESFWGTRVQWAAALAESKSSLGAELWAKVFGVEKDPRALGLMLDSIAGVKNTEVRKVVLRRVKEGLPPKALGAAYRVLGTQREEAPFKLLAKAASEPGFAGFAQSGAFHGLAETRDKKARKHLLARLEYGGSHERVRWSAASALGKLAPWIESDKRRREIVEALIDTLDQRSDRLRRTSVNALASIGDAIAIPPLEAMQTRVAAQERLDPLKAVKRIRAKAGKQPSTERVEKLEEQLKKLTARLAELETKSQDPAATDE